ncbi:MAG: hypothetical protein ACR2F8_09175 [Caulobacteraceae bacterium]
MRRGLMTAAAATFAAAAMFAAAPALAGGGGGGMGGMHGAGMHGGVGGFHNPAGGHSFGDRGFRDRFDHDHDGFRDRFGWRGGWGGWRGGWRGWGCCGWWGWGWGLGWGWGGWWGPGIYYDPSIYDYGPAASGAYDDHGPPPQAENYNCTAWRWGAGQNRYVRVRSACT